MIIYSYNHDVKRAENVLQNIKQKTKDRETRTSLKPAAKSGGTRRIR